MNRKRKEEAQARKAVEAKRLAACRALYCYTVAAPGCDFCARHWASLEDHHRAAYARCETTAQVLAARSNAVRFIAVNEGPVG